MSRIWILTALVLLGAGCKKDDSAAQQLSQDIIDIKQWLADRNLDAQATATGLHFIHEKEGVGANPGKNSKVTVHYKGYYLDGTVFDQSKAGQPVSFFLYEVIKGWQEGIPLMKKGGKATLLIPSGLAYGPQPPHPSIRPNAVMIFEVELLDFNG